MARSTRWERGKFNHYRSWDIETSDNREKQVNDYLTRV